MKKICGGLLVILEGGEGVGKTTHAKALVEYYNSQGYSAKYFREPGGNPLAEQLRTMILYNEIDVVTETLLFTAARSINVQKNLLPSLRNGDIIILDRFTKSTLVYQGILKHGDLDFINNCINEVTKDLYATDEGYSIEFTLLCDPEEAVKRAQAEGHERNKYDTMTIDKYKIINNAYHDLWRETSGSIPCLINTTKLSQGDVFKRLVTGIDKILEGCDIDDE